jgi:hypothetical protein
MTKSAFDEWQNDGIFNGKVQCGKCKKKWDENLHNF